jgi:hypothetical protein
MNDHTIDPIAVAFLELRPDTEPDHAAYLDLAEQGDCLASLDADDLELEFDARPAFVWDRRKVR